MPLDEGIGDELLRSVQSIGIELNDRQVAQILGHLELLVKWSGTYNLTAIRDPAGILRQHLLDSLSIVPALLRAGQSFETIVDVGSGAGFPGLTLAIAMPESKVICIDSVGKKVGFIRQVIGELDISNAAAEHSRIELLEAINADLITSRAFASLADFTRLSRKHLALGGAWVAMKGRSPEQEIAELKSDIDVFHVEHLLVPGLDGQRCLVWMRPGNGTPGDNQ